MFGVALGAMELGIGSTVSHVPPVRVRAEVLDRLASRQANAVSPAAEVGVPARVPAAWLERLGRKQRLAGGGNLAGRLEEPAMATPGPRVAVSLLAKLRTDILFAEVEDCATRHRSAAATSTRAAMRDVSAKQDAEAYAQAATAFLRGPRQLRDRFGSLLDGTDRTSDVVWEGVVDLRTSMVADVADLCKQTRFVRAEVPGDEEEGCSSPPPSPGVRRRALEALRESDVLLERCEQARARRKGHEIVGTDHPGCPLPDFPDVASPLLATPSDVAAAAMQSPSQTSPPMSPTACCVRAAAKAALQESTRLLSLASALETRSNQGAVEASTGSSSKSCGRNCSCSVNANYGRGRHFGARGHRRV